MLRKFCMFALAGLFLAACGSSTEDRALSGAGIGAGAGAVVGAVTGVSVVHGVLLGAAAGAATGALTTDKQVNLGQPVWKKSASAGSGTERDLVRNIQSGLNAQGYDAGPADGVAGSRTREAIRRYQQNNSLMVDGQPSYPLLEHLQKKS